MYINNDNKYSLIYDILYAKLILNIFTLIAFG